MNRDDHERAIFEQALNLPGTPEPYDLSQPFDAQKLMDGFELVEERQDVGAADVPALEGPIDPDSPLGRAMAEGRAAWAQPGYVPLDPETWKVEPIPVQLDDE